MGGCYVKRLKSAYFFCSINMLTARSTSLRSSKLPRPSVTHTQIESTTFELTGSHLSRRGSFFEGVADHEVGGGKGEKHAAFHPLLFFQ